MDVPIVGCESIMAPGYFEWKGNIYTAFCIKRTWFNKDYEAVEVWDPSKMQAEWERLGRLSPEEFWKEMAKEVEKF